MFDRVLTASVQFILQKSLNVCQLEVLVICLLNSAMYQIILFTTKSTAKSTLCSTYLLNNEIIKRVSQPYVSIDYMISVSLYLTLCLFI